LQWVQTGTPGSQKRDLAADLIFVRAFSFFLGGRQACSTLGMIMVSEAKSHAPRIKVRAEVTPGEWREFQFRQPFKIGRLKDCDLAIDNSFVSRVHAEVVFENGHWTVRDLGSANGLFFRGERVPFVQVDGLTTVRLGVEGPEVKLEVEKPLPEPPPQKTLSTKDPALAHYINHYFSRKTVDEPVGEHTMFIRQAFAQVETRRRKKNGAVIAVLVILIIGAGLFGYLEHRQLQQQKATAEDLFYAIKTQDIDLANLDRALANSNSQAGAEELTKFRDRRREMEKSYDKYLATLQIYNPKLTEKQRVVLRIARVFGECEIDMPPDFEKEINRYIEKWKTSGRLKQAIQTAQQNGYTTAISRDLLARGLPPQFFYLALQESNFNAYAVGPMTRKGFAKGMWQFIPETAVKYGLHLGPLVDQPRGDPGDDRHDYKKATRAATLYIQDLYGTDAQASGFLVMACYNWGEGQVLPLIRSLPANPRDRNFWKLLTKYRGKIPQETYDYVFSIASAAVIGENPRLFGFDFDNPLANLDASRNLVDEREWTATEIAAASYPVGSINRKRAR
jgi:membrane-bound lytic murein transglycosylase D